MTPTSSHLIRFGPYELDVDAGQLRKGDRIIRLQPQPFKLLWLLTSRPGRLLTRDEIRAALWTGDTFIDFEQGVNFAIKQVREALSDDSDNPLYIQTVPKRGYRFIAPVDGGAPAKQPTRLGTTDLNLQKVLWTNIAELRMAEAKRAKQMKVLIAVAAVAVGALVVIAVIWATR